MPFINKKYLHERNIPYKTASREEASKFYGSLAWKRLRESYFSRHPLCMECLNHDRVTPAEDVHHIRPWSSGSDEIEKWALLLDENNLISLCSKCHHGYHNKMREYNLQSVRDLTQSEYNYIHGLNYNSK